MAGVHLGLQFLTTLVRWWQREGRHRLCDSSLMTTSRAHTSHCRGWGSPTPTPRKKRVIARNVKMEDLSLVMGTAKAEISEPGRHGMSTVVGHVAMSRCSSYYVDPRLNDRV